MYWKNAGRVTDKTSGPSHPESTSLSLEEKQVICESRRLTRFSLDDIYLSLRDKIPRQTQNRSATLYGGKVLPWENITVI